jgi:hypothetical protein
MKTTSCQIFVLSFNVLAVTFSGRYISEFKTMVRLSSESKLNLVIGEPFDIDYIYETLASLKAADLTFSNGRQEDAQEFLSFLLNQLHDEMVKCLESLNPNYKENTNVEPHNQGDSGEPNEESQDDSDWNVVGKKNRAHVTRKVEFKQSPLSDIFCGQFRSALSQPGVKDKDSLSLEPFFTLPLDIQVVYFFNTIFKLTIFKNSPFKNGFIHIIKLLLNHLIIIKF